MIFWPNIRRGTWIRSFFYSHCPHILYSVIVCDILECFLSKICWTLDPNCHASNPEYELDTWKWRKVGSNRNIRVVQHNDLCPWLQYLKVYIMTILIEQYYKWLFLSISIEWYALYIGNIVNVIKNINYITHESRKYDSCTWFMLIKSYMNLLIHIIIIRISWFFVLSSIVPLKLKV